MNSPQTWLLLIFVIAASLQGGGGGRCQPDFATLSEQL